MTHVYLVEIKAIIEVRAENVCTAWEAAKDARVTAGCSARAWRPGRHEKRVTHASLEVVESTKTIRRK